MDDPTQADGWLEHSVTEAFIERSGAAAFGAVAKAFSELSPSCAGILVWPDSWGSYGLVVGPAVPRTIQADEWARLAADLGDGSRGSALEGFPGLSAPWKAYVLPLKDRKATIGMAGVAAPDPESAAAPLARIALASGQIQALVAGRVHEIRSSLMKQVTETAFAASERRFRDFLDASLDFIFISDAKGVLSLASRAASEMLGLGMDKIIGQPLSSFCPFPETQDLLFSKIASEGKVRDFEVSFRRADGNVIVTTESASAVHGPDGSVAEVHGIIRDITERLKGQRELWKANIELSKANEDLLRTQRAMVQQEKLASIGQLAAGIAHEINNPLGFTMSDYQSLKRSCAAMAEALRAGKEAKGSAVDAKLDEAVADLPAIFREMEEGFGRISEIVKNLRSFARSDENEEKRPYDLNEAVRRAFVIARNEIKYAADVSLDLGAPPSPPALPGEIDQVLLNIVVNAAQAIASEKRQARGRIAARTGSTDALAWVEIEDDGPGVPESAKERLFEPFFTTKAPGKGTGLGLSISWDIVVRKHGGSLSFAPGRRGRGTVFRIELPLEKKAEAKDGAAG